MSEIHLKNYRWPAEWEAHSATWVSWPVNAATWPGIFERIPPAFAAFVAAMARFEPVNILLKQKFQQDARKLIQTACESVAATFEVRFFDFEVDDSWCRDYGPIFLNHHDANAEQPQIILDWDYNAWGGKYPPWDNDAVAADYIAEQLSLLAIKPGIILEGGAIEGNGARTILTTENCLLNPNRNPTLDRNAVEEALREFLQATSVVWLPGHGVIGDDTDGHIDQVARFVDARSVLVASAYDDDAPEAADLRANMDAVQRAKNSANQSLIAHELILPPPKFQQEHRLPASYCNFHIVNGGVIVPTFGDAADDAALQVLQNAFPDRKIVGVSAIDLIWGLGAFHCMTQQQPAIR